MTKLELTGIIKKKTFLHPVYRLFYEHFVKQNSRPSCNLNASENGINEEDLSEVIVFNSGIRPTNCQQRNRKSEIKTL
jgi:hypothetical protein